MISAADAAAAMLAAARGGPSVCVVLFVDGPHAARRILCFRDRIEGSSGDVILDQLAVDLARTALETGERGLRTLEGTADTHVFLDPVIAPERLVVVGAGHIGVPLAALGLQLGFLVTVLDDRAEFANVARFAPGVQAVHAEFTGDPFADVTIDERTYIALVTRGHAWDFDCLRLLLERAVLPRYIGMIGSRRRVRAAFSALLDAGIPRARLAPIRAPIGLDVGAETPFEIALSIAAELVHARRGGTAQPLTQRDRVLERLLPEASNHDG